ncbi:Hypothetical predicted protein, partial [Mytilus galloprovincialis]
MSTTNFKIRRQLDPPVIVVCTNEDKVKDPIERKNRQEQFIKNLGDVLNEKNKAHIRNIYFVSNTEDDDVVFEEIRENISSQAKLMNDWGKDCPLKWLLFQQVLGKLKETDVPISTTKALKKIARHKDIGITDDEEFVLCLQYYHDIGTIIYFDEETLRNYIILDPEWLVDAFRCLVSDKITDIISLSRDWKVLKERGELTSSLISLLFEKEPKLKFLENKEHLLEVMKRFDIVVNVANSDTLYMPCMMEACSFTAMQKKFMDENHVFNRTSWLCFQFDFLPPVFFHHVLAWCIKHEHWDVSEIVDSESATKRFALYRQIGVFNLDKSGCEQLVICEAPNVIAMQVWNSGSSENTYKQLRCTFSQLISNICCRYRLNVSFIKTFKCKDGNFVFDRKEMLELLKMEFRCNEHKCNHFSDELLEPWGCTDEKGQGDQSDSVYIILTGRLRSVRTHHNGKKSLVAEYGRGELVGIVEVLTDTARTTTIMAVRDTECAHLPGDLLNLIKRKYPQIVTRLIHLLGQRILGHIETRDEVHMNLDHVSGIDKKVSVGNLSTIAVLGSNQDVPLTSFTLELQHSLQAIGLTTRLTSDIVKQNLGTGAFDSINEFRLFNWLGQQEDMNIITLYQCDYSMTRWTKHCIRQADCILIVGLAKNDPSVGEVEKQMENIAVRAQKELVLLHEEDAESPKGTIEWLNARGWCSSHHHIRCPKRVLKKQAEVRVVESYERVYQTKPDRLSDFSRLARFLTGTSVGLVLGGGGARGLSHIGIVKALLEAEVPIDMVGGTSMGSFVGAVWCEDRNITRFTQRCREWSMDMTSIWQKVLDLTYPITSMFTGQSFNVTLEKTFKDRQIEDLWIPYFCITTDITSSSMRIHTHGSLWRYVRASMSLSGYLPPLCDPIDAHYLLDGGYVNNLPADVMKQLGANSIFAVDVGSRDSTESYNYGDKISGFWLLANKWSPWSETVKVPDMAEIQSRLAYVSCVRQLDHVKNSDYCEYIRPPIDKYGTLQFGSFDEIAELRYLFHPLILEWWSIKEKTKNNLKKKKRSNSIDSTNVYKICWLGKVHLPDVIKKEDQTAKLPEFMS